MKQPYLTILTGVLTLVLILSFGLLSAQTEMKKNRVELGLNYAIAPNISGYSPFSPYINQISYTRQLSPKVFVGLGYEEQTLNSEAIHFLDMTETQSASYEQAYLSIGMDQKIMPKLVSSFALLPAYRGNIFYNYSQVTILRFNIFEGRARVFENRNLGLGTGVSLRYHVYKGISLHGRLRYFHYFGRSHLQDESFSPTRFKIENDVLLGDISLGFSF